MMKEQPGDRALNDSENKQINLQTALAEYAKSKMIPERKLAILHPELFSPGILTVAEDSNLPSNILNHSLFRYRLSGLSSFNEHSPITILIESVNHHGNEYTIATTPLQLRSGYWQSKRIAFGTIPLNYSLTDNLNKITPSPVSRYQAEHKKLKRTLYSEYYDRDHQPDFSGNINQLARNAINEQKLVATMLLANTDKIDALFAESVVVPDRLMTQDEFKKWYDVLGLLSVSPKQVPYSKISRKVTLDYGAILSEELTDEQGNPRTDRYGTIIRQINYIVPLHVANSSVDAGTTAVFMTRDGKVENIVFHHGFRYLAQMKRSLL